MRTYKANLPEGVKQTFGFSKGVKIRLVNKNLPKYNKKKDKNK